MIPTPFHTDGISVLVFCYNSAGLIEHTLSCIAQQQTSRPWEVIVVDNNSKDQTSEVAARWLSDHCQVPWKVLHEPRQGLTFARERALTAAKHAHVLFVDDDNFLQGTHWLDTLLTLFDRHPEVGSIGGRSQGDTGTAIVPSWWLNPYTFCVGNQRTQEGIYIPEKPVKMLWGACLAMRTGAALHAWNAFPMLLTDRAGDMATAGGDVELGCRLLLLGYRSYYTPSLVFTHFMHPKRLTDAYLLSAIRGGRAVYPVLLAYQSRLQGKPVKPFMHMIQACLYYLSHSIYGMLSYTIPARSRRYYAWYIQRVELKEWKVLWLHYMKVRKHLSEMNALGLHSVRH